MKSKFAANLLGVLFGLATVFVVFAVVFLVSSTFFGVLVWGISKLLFPVIGGKALTFGLSFKVGAALTLIGALLKGLTN